MRNLKKFLALVLAMMMAFSLMVTANAANEKDNGTNKYADATVSDEFVEAVDVLYGMGIMTGDNGSFYGDRDVMRSEMSAVLYRLITGDTTQLRSPLYAAIAAERFSDVKETDWFAPYIGFCYDAGLVKGYDGKFNPWGYVNGYETLIMVLRAMGYGRNGEYEGAYWNVNASSDATLVGLLRDVDKSHYVNTLARNTKREVVASIVFNGAQLPTVTWTPSLGYNKYDGIASASATNRMNPSLGMKNFGLDYVYGVVIGNQSTGESKTLVSIGKNGTTLSRALSDLVENCYEAKTEDKNDRKVFSLDWTTDLRLFGHAVKVWYNNKNDTTTYALYDKAVKAEVVKANGSLTLDGTETGDTDLYKVVKNKGFTVNTTNGAWGNVSFGPNIGRGTAIANASQIKANNTSDDAKYYVVISNHANKQVDLVIALNVTVTQISQSNSVQDPKFVSVNVGTQNEYFGVTTDQVSVTTAYNDSRGKRLNILTDSLGASSIDTLGSTVCAVQITGTTGANDGSSNGNFANNSTTGNLRSTYYHELFPLTRTETKVVVARNPKTEEVTFDDGSTMKRSWLADTVADNRLLDVDASDNVKHAHAPEAAGTYTFTVDEDGAYIFWTQGTKGSTFIYGTYLDYQQPVATSTFTYPLVGVIDGKMETRNIVNGTENNGNDMNAAEYQSSKLPKRDADGKIGADVKNGVYQGFYIDADGEVSSVLEANNNTSEWKQGKKGSAFGEGVVVNKTDAAVGAKLVHKGSQDTGLYLTEGTKIHVVSGTGTDTQKVQTYNGIKDFLGASASITINADKVVGASGLTTSAQAGLTGSAGGEAAADLADMIYWTQKTFNYAQDYTTTAWAVDEVYIPLAAITRTGSAETSLYFIGDRTITLLNNTGTAASQFTMYNAKGGAESVWIMGLENSRAPAANSTDMIKEASQGNFFVNLVDSGKTANDGKPIYEIAAVSSSTTDNDAGVVGKYVQTAASGTGITLSDANDDETAASNYDYIASTYSQYIASIGSSRAKLWDVTGARVVNLYKDTFPGVDSIATLNAASSIKDAQGANQGVSVSAVVNADNGVKLDVIFVNSPDVSLP